MKYYLDNWRIKVKWRKQIDNDGNVIVSVYNGGIFDRFIKMYVCNVYRLSLSVLDNSKNLKCL